MKNLAIYLRILRSAKNYSQFGISTELGVKQSTYSRIENDPGKMTLKQLIILSNFYHVKPSDMLNYKEDDLINLQKMLHLKE